MPGRVWVVVDLKNVERLSNKLEKEEKRERERERERDAHARAHAHTHTHTHTHAGGPARLVISDTW